MCENCRGTKKVEQIVMEKRGVLVFKLVDCEYCKEKEEEKEEDKEEKKEEKK